MKIVLTLGIFVLCVAIFSGCDWFKGSSQSNNGQMVGNDKDAHGCIPSAGYTWCEAKQKCLRVWEEPCQ